VQRIARREVIQGRHQVARLQGVPELHGECLVGEAEQGVHAETDGVAPSDGRVPLEDLLDDLGVRHEAVGGGDKPLEDASGGVLVRMLGAHEVHGHVRVHEDQAPLSRYPRAISASIASGSAVG
jgi:hypothetical protein